MEIFTEFNEKERGFSLFFYLGFRTSSQGLVDSAQDLIFRNSLIKLANIPIIENPFNTLPKFESLILGYAQRLFAQKNGRKIIHAAGLKKNCNVFLLNRDKTLPPVKTYGINDNIFFCFVCFTQFL